MQDASLSEGSLEMDFMNSGCQAECVNTLDGSPRDYPVAEEDDAIIRNLDFLLRAPC